jgi:hypothetical protein
MGSVKAQPRFVFSSDQSPSRADSGHANPNQVTPPQGKVDPPFIGGSDFLDHRFEQTTFMRITRC